MVNAFTSKRLRIDKPRFNQIRTSKQRKRFDMHVANERSKQTVTVVFNDDESRLRVSRINNVAVLNDDTNQRTI